MTEARRSYRINNLTTQELNFVLQLLADRLDELEGRRGTPTFKGNVVMDGNRITDVGSPTDSTDAEIKGSLDTLTSTVSSLSDTVDTISSDLSAVVDPQTGYLNKAGISGGQVAYGGTGSGEDLILYSTSHATPGWVGYADSNGTVLIGWNG